MEFKFRVKAKTVGAVISFAFLAACGGGGSGSNDKGSASSSSVAPITYSLAKMNSLAVGPVYSAQLAGTDSTGLKYTGSISVANREQKVVNGVLVTPRELMLTANYAGGTGAGLTTIGTTLVDSATGNVISVSTEPAGLSCTSVSPAAMPASVKIGDFGVLPTMLCGSSGSQVSNWRVESAGNGRASIIQSAVMKNSLGITVTTAEVTYVLDAQGNLVAFKEIVTANDGFTLTFGSI